MARQQDGNKELRKLNKRGCDEFSAFLEELKKGAQGAAPLRLLTNPDTSEPLEKSIEPGPGQFKDKYSLGLHLKSLLSEFDMASIDYDGGLWSALALHWFDFLCPEVSGKRKILEKEKYIFNLEYNKYYRHLIRTPWQLVQNFGDKSRFLLTSSPSVHSELLEQVAGRQQLLSSEQIIGVVGRLYFDEGKERPKPGFSGREGGGTARRLGIVLSQFEMTHAPELMTEEAIMDLLPSEFDRWKP